MEIAAVTIWIACGIFSSMVASSKRRNGILWFVLGVLFGPLALLAVGFMPVYEPQATYHPSGLLICPRCDKLNLTNATRCIACGSALRK